jgi:hypothetical protein
MTPVIGDRIKRWMILGPTSVLPHGLRVSLRRDGLAQLELARAKRAELIIIGHPKSGNTWLRTMLSRLFQVRFGLESNFVVKSDELHRLNRAIPPILATNGYYSYEGIIGEVLDADAPRSILHDKKIVFLPRNPLDIAVSWFLQFTKRQSKYKREMINAFIDHPVDRHSISRWDFIRHSDIGLSCLIDFLNTWERNLARCPNAITIPYEELRPEPAKALQRICELCGWDFSAEEIADAVEWASFDNLRKLEAGGHFRSGGITLRNRDDQETFKVRRGKVGGYRDDLTPEQGRELEEIVAKRLSPSFGYASSLAQKEGSA